MGEILSKIYMFDPNKNSDGSAFTCLAEAVVMTENDRSADIKASLKEQLPEQLPWGQIRLREKLDSRLGATVKQGKTLKQSISVLRDGFELALQLVEVRAPYFPPS